MQQTSVMLANIAKAVEFNAEEIKDCKMHLQTVEKNRAELMGRVVELERYKRRWNLKIQGLKEEERENIREVVINLLVKISPAWAPNIHHIVDSVHRLGRLEVNRTRHVIVQFIQRAHRDELCKMTKDSAVCKELNICFMATWRHVLVSGQRSSRQDQRASEPTTEEEMDTSMEKHSL